MEQIRGELQPLTGAADDTIEELRRLATTLEARPAAPNGWRLLQYSSRNT
jgi:hypothetical protein